MINRHVFSSENVPIKYKENLHSCTLTIKAAASPKIFVHLSKTVRVKCKTPANSSFIFKKTLKRFRLRTLEVIKTVSLYK
jgi:hypothetical protein